MPLGKARQRDCRQLPSIFTSKRKCFNLTSNRSGLIPRFALYNVISSHRHMDLQLPSGKWFQFRTLLSSTPRPQAQLHTIDEFVDNTCLCPPFVILNFSALALQLGARQLWLCGKIHESLQGEFPGGPPILNSARKIRRHNQKDSCLLRPFRTLRKWIEA